MQNYNKYLDKIQTEFDLLDQGCAYKSLSQKTIIRNLFNYCKELEARLQKVENTQIVFGFEIPEMLEYAPGEITDSNGLAELGVDIEDGPSEPIRFPPAEEVIPTELHVKRKPANDWLFTLAEGYLHGTVTKQELGVYMDHGDLTIEDYQFIIDYTKPRTEI